MVFHLFERFFGTFGDPQDRIWGNTTKGYLVIPFQSHPSNFIRSKMVSLKKKLQISHGSMAKKITGNSMVPLFMHNFS